MQPVVHVAVPVPLRRLFDYLPPRSGLPAPGCRVEVELGTRKLIGVVVGSGPAQDPAQKLKPIRRVLDDTPLVAGELLHLWQRTADYYRHPLGVLFATALPTALR